MGDFRFELEDLLDFDDTNPDQSSLAKGTQDAIVREMGKHYSGPLETTQASTGFRGAQFSTLNIGNVIMGDVLIKDQATVLNKDDFLLSNLVGGALTTKDNTTGSLGLFDALVPKDIKFLADRKRKKDGFTATTTIDPVTGLPVTTGGGAAPGTVSGEAVYYANQLLANPNFRYQRGSNEDLMKRSLSDGYINPWLIAIMKILCDNFIIYLYDFDVHTPYSPGRGGSGDHPNGNAVDIGDFAPLGSGPYENMDPIAGNTALVQSIHNCLASINGPYRPTQIIASNYPDFFHPAVDYGRAPDGPGAGISYGANPDHGSDGNGAQGHFHVACNHWPQPGELPPPPVASQAPNLAQTGPQ